MPGGHHFGSGYSELADVIFSKLTATPAQAPTP
jgi:type IV secretory pathway VirJ component